MFCTKILHVMSMILKTMLSASAVHVLAVKKMNVQENDCRWQCKGLMLWQSKAQHPPYALLRSVHVPTVSFSEVNKTSLNLILMLMPLVNWGAPHISDTTDFRFYNQRSR